MDEPLGFHYTCYDARNPMTFQIPEVKVKTTSTLIAALVIFSFVGIAMNADAGSGPVKTGTSKTAKSSLLDVPTASPFVPDANDLVDPASHYSAPLNLLNVRLKAVQGDKYTIADVNTDLDPYDSFVPEIKVHFEADDYPEDSKADNAKLRIRGNSSRLGQQKSYRVKLNSGLPSWRGEMTLQLNKHPWDLARVRNKLAFDFFCDIPYLNSLRTQFVHLTFDDDADPATPDVDYGLFTHVEKMGKDYLTNRGWSTSSNMYKAADFTFRKDSRLALDANGTPLNSVDFERVLEIENGTNHTALLQMISAIDSDSNDFVTEFSKYFNRNNYLTWMAVNILMGNRDIRTQNFALLQPAGTTSFYFLPWDYDGAFGFERQPDIAASATLYADWQLGLSNFWGIPLHQRFLQQPGNLADLEAAVEVLRSLYLGSDKIQAKIDSYKPLIESLITHDPDLAYLPTLSQDATSRQQEWAAEFQRLSTVVVDNYNGFRQRLEKPMPFWQAANADAGKLVLTWDPSVDLQNDAVTYQVSIARQPNFSEESIVLLRTGVTGTRLETDPLPNGDYYMKVLAVDSKGYTQEAFDRLDENGGTYFGVIKFSLSANGTCGGSNGDIFSAPPVSNLCSTGTESTVTSTPTGPWTWDCIGDNNWPTVSCSATKTYPLYATLGGTGGGSISGNLSCLNGEACPQIFVAANTTVNLSPLADRSSLFDGWSGACINRTGSCTFIMDAPKTVVAAFVAAPKATVGSKGFPGFQTAYNDAETSNNAVIKLLEGTLTEDLIFSRNIEVTLAGGYDAHYNGISAVTTIAGKVVINAGKVIIGGLIVR